MSTAATFPVVAEVHNDKRYRAIFDAAAIGILQCSLDGRVLDSNPALQRMLGYSRERLRGMHFRDFTHPDDLAADSALFEEMVAGKRSYYQIELRYRGNHETTGWVRLTVSLVPDAKGQPESVIGMVEDITEHRRTEEQLREAQKMEVIGRLVGGVAHDFNNLLTGIMLYCDLIHDGLDPNSHLRHHTREISLAAQHGAALVQQLLAVARQQPCEPQLLSLNEMIAGMQNLLRRLISENIRLTTKFAPGLWPVKMDPAQVQQIVFNLALNARDALPEGGNIRLETRNVPANGSAEMVELIVADNGCGISQEVRARLFEPFFTTKADGQGTGLGLATVKRILSSCGGSIVIDSEPGRGTKVMVRLPRVPDGKKVQTPSVVPLDDPHPKATILLIEDDSAVRRSALRVLKDSGYSVLEAANGAQALQLCEGRSQHIDLLLVDLTMPGMSGRQVAQKLRTRCPKLPVLYVSGYMPSATFDERDSVVLFRKPFSSDALLQKVRETLNQPPASTIKRGPQ